MRIKSLPLFATLCFATITSAQDKLDVVTTKDSIVVTNADDKTTSVFYLDINSAQKLRDAVKDNYIFETNYNIKEEKGDKFMVTQRKNTLFNEAMLNVLFAEEVSSYIGESKDLSLKKSYAVISTADKTLFLGGSFIAGRKKDTDRLKHIITVGLKTKLDKEFASILGSNRNLENEIGVNFKYTLIGRGIINYGCYEDEVKRLKEKVIVGNAVKKIEGNIKNEVYVKELKEYEDIYGKESTKYKEKSLSYYQKKYESTYLELANTEIDRIRSEKLYSHIWNHYFTAETFIPASRKFYNVLETPTDEVVEKPFYPWKINVGYTNFWKSSYGKTLYLSGFASVFNNNNIEVGEIKTKTLQTLNTINPNLINKSTSVYDGAYSRFTSGSVKVEAVTYLFKEGTFGLSGAIEQYIGSEYNPLDWKLGIPVSLKDKEGKPAVNFELQWKVVNGDHFVGLGVGFAFGKFMK